MKSRKWAVEITILSALLLLFLLFVGNLSNWEFSTWNIALHDTYFVFDVATAFLWFFFIPVYLVYCIRIFLGRIKSSLVIAICILSNGFLLVGFDSIEVLIKTIAMAASLDAEKASSGWTIYPPLSSLPEQHHFGKPDKMTASVIMVVRAILVLTFGIIVFRFGKQLGNKSNGN